MLLPLRALGRHATSWLVVRPVLLTVALAGLLSARDYLLALGLLLASYGLALVWLPAAFIVPGAVLAAVAVFGVR
ncbi:MAG: hypothetical protein J0I92_05405 [Phyllobacterium sp.]|nr:hypothetical protein [Phyllobacterium sp.]ODT13083.1 MAG: hypothetical protein ABS57_19775 [Mesorhizobium sp. SCN 65-12]